MHWIRYFLFLISFGTVAVISWISSVYVLLVFFTSWTAIVTMISIGLSIWVTSTDDVHIRLGLQAVHHIFYSASILMNVVTVSVYWSLIHDHCLVKFAGNELDINVRCYIVHIIPGLACLGNTYLTNSKLSPRFVPGLVAFGIFYAALNFVATKQSGKPLYPFLTWEGIDSVLIIAAMITVFSLFYLVLCWIDGRLKHESLTLLLERRQRRLNRKQKDD